jgi:hypothetical protein
MVLPQHKNVTLMSAVSQFAQNCIAVTQCINEMEKHQLHTWVISKDLHTVRFLFKNEFILQNTFTGLQCNLHCALSQQFNVWESLVFLSGRLRY